jgi:hypothetical protein
LAPHTATQVAVHATFQEVPSSNPQPAILIRNEVWLTMVNKWNFLCIPLTTSQTLLKYDTQEGRNYFSCHLCFMP